MLDKLVGGLLQTTLRMFPKPQVTAPINESLSITSPWSVISIRNKIRNNFPRPNERRRILRHGWKARMSTPGGRRVLMRRILKGYPILSH